MKHKSCIENSFMRQGLFFLLFMQKLFLWVSTKVDWLFDWEVEINDELLGINTSEMSLFSGDAPEMIALHA